MYAYVLKRLLMMIPTLFGAALLVFLLLRAIPGDICYLRLAGSGGTVDLNVVDQCRLDLGLDEPLWRQFWEFIYGFVTLDFGKSMWTGRPIIEEVGLRFELSLQIAIMATIVSILISIPFGTLSAVKQDTWIDHSIRALSIAGIAMPSFWLGMLIIFGILATSKAWFGHSWMPPITYTPLWVDPMHNLSMLIWPAIATGYRYAAVATRMTRSAMLEVLREDYVRTARAKGLLEHLEYTLAELPRHVDSEWEPYVSLALAVRDRMIERWMHSTRRSEVHLRRRPAERGWSTRRSCGPTNVSASRQGGPSPSDGCRC